MMLAQQWQVRGGNRPLSAALPTYSGGETHRIRMTLSLCFSTVCVSPTNSGETHTMIFLLQCIVAHILEDLKIIGILDVGRMDG